MKMQRGELVGFQGCLGYDYHPEDKSISINEKEAEIVRYIFQRYVEGAGGSIISRELENLGYKTKRGTPTRSEEHTSELQSRGHLVCRLLLEKKNNTYKALNT